MGAWDFGVFDDDTAYDFFEEIEKDPKAFFKSSFEYAISAEYLEYDECHAVTVSSAYLDNYLNGTSYRTDNEDDTDISNINLFKELHNDLVLDDLKALAIKALQKVISDKSELNELWAENEELYPQWKGNLQAIIDRLNK